jgi:pimeloyl-ACP methyl ester carboxylesterase
MNDGAAEQLLQAMMAPPRRRKVPRIAEPLKHIEMQSVDAPQGKIAAWRIGEGPAVLLVHGFEDDNALWTPLLDALGARGRATVVFDLPGHGLSEGDSGFAPAGAEAMMAVAKALGPIDAVAGHSIGCWATALAVNEGLNVDRLVLMAAPLGATSERWRRAAMRLDFPDEVGDRALALYRERLGPTRSRELHELLASLRNPMLFIHSRDDDRAPFEAAQQACANCTDAQLLTLDGAGHRETAQQRDAIAGAVMFLDTE